MDVKTYHHGDLRGALVAAGLAALARGEEVALRALAREVGVSAPAVYRHFPDKAALVAALAREGFARLAADQRAAAEAAGGGLAGFGATGAAYVRFARDNPALFRLIFAHPHAHDEPEEAMAMLRANARAAAGPGVDADVVALQAWSLAHGLAMLLLDGQVDVDDATIDRVIDARMLRA